MRVWPILVAVPTVGAIAAHLAIAPAEPDAPALHAAPSLLAAPAPPAPQQEDASGIDGLSAFALETGAGATLFARHCAACHGWRGEGGPMAPALDPLASADRIRAAIRRGAPARSAGFGPMPPVEALSDAEIDTLIRHLGALRAAAR